MCHCVVAKVLEAHSLVTVLCMGIAMSQTLILWLCWDLWAKEMGQHQRALVCHSWSDPATFSFSEVSHACLSPALCNLPSCCVCRATACDHDILHCCTTSCPSHGQLKGGFETTPYISSLWKWLRLTLAMLKLNYLSTLADLLCLWPVFCACWASAVLHPEVVPSWCCVHPPLWSLVKPQRQPGCFRMEGAIINVSS